MLSDNHTVAILAINNHDLTIYNLELLIKNNCKNILLFDNGSNPSYKLLAAKYDIQYYREKKKYLC